MTILFYILIFFFGVILGTFVGVYILPRLKRYSGVLEVTVDEAEDKLLYSIVLFGDPEDLQYENEVLFKVDNFGGEAYRE